mgnify:FL=1
MSTRLMERLEPRFSELAFPRARTRPRKTEALQELHAILPPLIAALAGGANIREALEISCESASGELAARLRLVAASGELGARLEESIEKLLLGHPEPAVQELATKLATAQRYGTGLVRQLNSLASSVDEELHQQRLRQAAKSETRMLLPLVFLILPITVVFALYPSLTIIQTNY